MWEDAFIVVGVSFSMVLMIMSLYVILLVVMGLITKSKEDKIETPNNREAASKVNKSQSANPSSNTSRSHSFTGEVGAAISTALHLSEIEAAISTALHLYYDVVHDEESYILTIKRTSPAYSLWQLQ